ncbi:LysR family transcriptional regulator [Limnohabitans sp. Bal53]|jgi:DNA-binding transcriptional LysR family regulator|uniref:LysR family transcriptional regulator n=1 Tax=Limnohabitans sp. Bal53 TaxID=1977910 RepID=UPI000D3C8AED|nr:LysR family transcriptional regulator [Limnohabitans sp. Bal53]PUE40151.1 LysR family transcriptional regulator [Limnohabitans sp. Bal53]
MDKYQEMRVFSAVVEASSFVGAADSLDMSKAAVSRYVSELEQRLGVRLLHRTTRRLSLTPEGEVFLARCREILSSIEASEVEITTRSVSVSGLLKVSVPVSFGIRHMAPLWPDFLDLHPQLNLDVQLADRLIDLVDEGFDLAIRIARLEDSSLISRQIAATRLVLCAAPSYLERRGVPAHPSDLATHDVVGYSLLATGDQWQFEGPDGPVSVKVRPRFWSNNGDSCIAACVQGAGIQLQPTFLIDEELRRGALVEVLPQYQAATLGIYAVYPTRKFVLPKVRALIEFLDERLKAAPWTVI